MNEGEVLAIIDDRLVPSERAKFKSQYGYSLKRKLIFEDSLYPSKGRKAY